jgi:hypothetical protein
MSEDNNFQIYNILGSYSSCYEEFYIWLHAGVLFGLLCSPEDGGDILLQIVG